MMSSNDAHLLAIDVGTLSARAGLFDRTGQLIAARSAGFALMHPLNDHAVYRMDDIWAAVCAATRAALADAIDRVCFSGGHLKNPLLVQLYRDALGADLVTSATTEPVLLGTAMVAAVAAGLYADLFTALETMSPVQTTHRINPSWAAAHDIAYGIYLKLFDIRNQIDVDAQRLDLGVL